MRGLVELVVTLFVALAIAFAVQALIVKPYKVPSASMEPTLVPGQRVLVSRLSGPSDGEVVVFHPPVGAEQELCADPSAGVGHARPCDRAAAAAQSEYFIKRVIAGPGQTVAIRSGHVYVNGRQLSESGTTPCGGGPECSFAQPITIPHGEWFMMGDNRGDSDDSRFWGPVPTSWVIGPAFATYWPPDRIGGV